MVIDFFLLFLACMSLSSSLELTFLVLVLVGSCCLLSTESQIKQIFDYGTLQSSLDILSASDLSLHHKTG